MVHSGVSAAHARHLQRLAAIAQPAPHQGDLGILTQGDPFPKPPHGRVDPARP
jgi:hypothetical protein